MSKKRPSKRGNGFTLVELMIVVAIIGTLAALAIYGVSRYLKHSKTAEATRSLGSIETGSKNKFQQETDSSLIGAGPFYHQFCPSSTAGVPAAIPMASKVMAASALWNDDCWVCLKFSINEPQLYQYNYVNNGSTGTAAGYTATALGDLDGNGVNSTFALRGAASPILGDAQRVSLTFVNEDE